MKEDEDLISTKLPHKKTILKMTKESDFQSNDYKYKTIPNIN